MSVVYDKLLKRFVSHEHPQTVMMPTGGGSSLTVQEADGSPQVRSVKTIVVSNGTLTDNGAGQVTISTGGGAGGGAWGSITGTLSDQTDLQTALDAKLDDSQATAFGLSLLDDANAAAAITTLGLDADLATFSLPASTTISAFGATLVDDAAASNARTTLGLGTAAVVATDLADLNEATIEAAIDTLANLTSVQGQTISISAPLTIPADPNADRMLFWDDSAGATAWLATGNGLTITTTTIDVDTASATVDGIAELATDAETVTGTDTGRVTTPANITAKMAAPGTIGGTTPANITGLVITANTRFAADANDGAVLGASGTAFSDLFLASGAVIDFNAGDVTLTHAAGIVTVAGSGAGDLRVTTAGTNAASVVTVGGTQTLTSKTLTSPTLTTPSAFTTGGTITLAENTSIALDPAGSADGKYSGITVTGTGGATIAFGDLVTLDKDDSRWELVDISVAAAATGDARGVLGIAVTSSSDGGAITVLLEGIVRADANFPALTIGANVYASTTGDIVVTQPTTTDHVIRIVGAALTADEIFFRPDFNWITHT